MSSLHHEEILEDCYEQSYESFKKSNKLRNIFGSASIITYRIEKTTKYNKKFTNIFISTYL